VLDYLVRLRKDPARRKVSPLIQFNVLVRQRRPGMVVAGSRQCRLATGAVGEQMANGGSMNP
jgi:hypothetical protein